MVAGARMTKVKTMSGRGVWRLPAILLAGSLRRVVWIGSVSVSPLIGLSSKTKTAQSERPGLFAEERAEIPTALLPIGEFPG